MYTEKILSEDKEYLIEVGRNAKENWSLIDKSDDDTLWFHVEDKPSCHVFIKLNVCAKLNVYETLNVNIPHDVIIRGAHLCKLYSKYKNDKKVKIIYTKINNIHKGKDIGSVNIIANKKVNFITI